jgi:hypothetical protein
LPLILDAVALEEEELPTLEAPLASETSNLTTLNTLGNATGNQRLVFALLAKALDEGRQHQSLVIFISYLLVPIMLILGVVFSLMLLLGLWALCGWVNTGSSQPQNLEYLLYAVLVYLFLTVRVMKGTAESPKIDFDFNSSNRIESFRLGRLRNVFSSGAPGTLALFLGFSFGAMWGLLWLTPNHGGLPIQGYFFECFFLTLDNLLHGVFLDVCELYDIHFGEKVVHTFWSATLFNLFRLTFDALVILLLYEAWQRWRLRRLFSDMPDYYDVNAFLFWLAKTCADRSRLPAGFLDEVMFLVLAKEYLSSNFAFVRQLSQQFPQLPVVPRVRALFRGPNGEIVFHGEYSDT